MRVSKSINGIKPETMYHWQVERSYLVDAVRKLEWLNNDNCQ
jgi:hypothetical protein